MQGLFILAGIALIIVGFNSTRPLIIVGFMLIFLAIYARKKMGGDRTD